MMHQVTDVISKCQARLESTFSPPIISAEDVRRVCDALPGNEQKAEEVRNLAKAHGKSWDVLINFLQSGKPVSQVADLAELITSTVEACDLAVGDAVEGRTALFMLGARGSGKSTTGNWIAGSDYQIVEDEDDDRPYLKTMNEGGSWFRVGDDRQSVTFLPSCKLIPHPLGNDELVALVDFAGFKDTCGEAVTIAFDIAFRKLVRRAAKAHALMVTSITSVDERASALEQSLMKACKLLPTKVNKLESNKPMPAGAECSWVIGVTKCHKMLEVGSKAKFKLMKTAVQDMMEAADSVANLCDFMFDTDGTPQEGGRERFISFVLKASSIPKPTSKMTRLHAACKIEALTSDCLSSDDVERIEVFFKNKYWMDALREKFAKRTELSTIFDKESLEASRDELDKLLNCQKKVVGYLRQRVQYFQRQYTQLQQGFFPLEDECQYIASLVQFCQPRLNSIIVSAGRELCEQEILETTETAKMIKYSLDQLKDKLDAEGVRRIAVAETQLHNTEQIIAESKGYKNAAEMKRNISSGTTIVGSTVSGATALACIPGGVQGMVWTEAAIFATGSSVAGTIAALSGVGLAVLLIGGAVVAYQHGEAVRKDNELQANETRRSGLLVLKGEEQSTSEKIAKVFVESFNELEKLQKATQAASDAYQAQSKAMVGFSVEASRLLTTQSKSSE